MEKTELIKEVLALQNRIERALKPVNAEPWIELKMTIAQLKSLFFIADKGKTNFKKLADALEVTPPNITGIIDRLVEQGLVSRTESTEDRRIMLLQITSKGTDLINTLHENRTIQMTSFLIAMTEEELNSAITGFKGIVKAIEAYPGKKSE
jgi:MarR family transcriptional regulator, organic hydroperoxide resistance regulator